MSDDEGVASDVPLRPTVHWFLLITPLPAAFFFYRYLFFFSVFSWFSLLPRRPRRVVAVVVIGQGMADVVAGGDSGGV